MSAELAPHKEKLSILITGGTGFIGSHLSRCLFNEKHHITILTRDAENAHKKLNNDFNFIENLTDTSKHYDVIINLAGKSLNEQRWNETVKQQIINSRIKTTEQIINFIKTCEQKPELLINGSAIGYYGTSLTEQFTENSQPVTYDFPHQICKLWEEQALEAKSLGVRVCCLRTGVVLGKNGGVLTSMLLPFNLGLGGKLGKGNQWMSWIHLDDLVSMIKLIIDNKELNGPINAVAPNPATNEEFSDTLAKVLNRPRLLMIPAFQAKLMFGEMADALLLKGQYVLPEKMQFLDFKFCYKTLKKALENILYKK